MTITLTPWRVVRVCGVGGFLGSNGDMESLAGEGWGRGKRGARGGARTRRPPAPGRAGGRAASVGLDQVTKKLTVGDQSLVVFETVVRKRKRTVVLAVMPSRLVLATVVVPMGSQVFPPSSEYCHS